MRSHDDPNALAAAVRAAIRNVDPTLPPGVGPLAESAESNTPTDRLMSLLSATFAVFATVLAAIGLDGVLAFNVTQRSSG